jgi:tRNA nucleotidyltransferase (CCA-adding enzyme)
MSDILKEALKLVEPAEKEREHVERIAKMSHDLVKKAAGKFDGITGVTFGGSYEKGTWLRGDVDVDIFVKIDRNVSEKEFERIGRQLGMHALKKYKPYLRYSQHPYVEAVVDGIRVNVVPCYDVEEGRWKSAADRSPYHTKFIISAFDEGKRREARLLKKFMKGIGVYGAEIARSGFSGYVCEVLILKYNSFMNVLKAAAEFREREVIGNGEGNDIAKIFDSALIILDPVDQKRNLGTAISNESVGRFILAARRFLKKPELRYFRGVMKESKGMKFIDNIIVVRFRHRARSQDIIWGQLKSSMNAIAKQLTINGFKVIRSGCSAVHDNSAFAFMLESMHLPEKVVKQGPKVFSSKDTARFLEKNYGRSGLFWVDSDARVLALSDNKFTSAQDFLKLLLGKNIGTSGIAKGLINDIRKGVDIYTGKKLSRVESYIREAMYSLVATDQFAFGTDT